MTPELIANLYALLLGFALSGLLASGYQVLAEKPLSFHLLQTSTAAALASVPLLTFGAPFVIMRNTVRGSRIESRRVESAMFATILACFWSLMSGTVAVDLVGRFFA